MPKNKGSSSASQRPRRRRSIFTLGEKLKTLWLSTSTVIYLPPILWDYSHEWPGILRRWHHHKLNANGFYCTVRFLFCLPRSYYISGGNDTHYSASVRGMVCNFNYLNLNINSAPLWSIASDQDICYTNRGINIVKRHADEERTKKGEKIRFSLVLHLVVIILVRYRISTSTSCRQMNPLP